MSIPVMCLAHVRILAGIVFRLWRSTPRPQHLMPGARASSLPGFQTDPCCVTGTGRAADGRPLIAGGCILGPAAEQIVNQIDDLAGPVVGEAVEDRLAFPPRHDEPLEPQA